MGDRDRAVLLIALEKYKMIPLEVKLAALWFRNHSINFRKLMESEIKCTMLWGTYKVQLL